MHFSKPVIAAVEGYAVAGGLELALMCDLRVAARGAVFGVFCRRWGVPLIDGGTVRLPRVVGMGRALDLILTGRAVAPTRRWPWAWPTAWSTTARRWWPRRRWRCRSPAFRSSACWPTARRPCAVGLAAGRGAAARRRWRPRSVVAEGLAGAARLPPAPAAMAAPPDGSGAGRIGAPVTGRHAFGA
jgi:hypothetical protein